MAAQNIKPGQMKIKNVKIFIKKRSRRKLKKKND